MLVVLPPPSARHGMIFIPILGDRPIPVALLYGAEFGDKIGEKLAAELLEN